MLSVAKVVVVVVVVEKSGYQVKKFDNHFFLEKLCYFFEYIAERTT